MADVKHSGVNRGEDTRFKVNNNIIRMMNANPALGTGYLIGSMLGENYWGKKRANTRQGVKEAWDKQNGSIGADENGVYGVGSKGPNYYDSMNKAFDEYSKGNPGGTYIDTAKGVYPQTPQQANKSTETPTVGQMWENMNNGSGYNAGNTGLFTNGIRNMGNVIGADENGVYGVPNGRVVADANGYYGLQAPAPKTPIQMSYTPEQLAQIQAYGKFTPEELQRMGAAELVAPPAQAAPTQSGGDSGLLGAIANKAAQAASAPVVEVPDPSESYPMVGQGNSGLTPAQIDTLNQIAAAAAREEEPIAPVTNSVAQQSDLAARYKKNINDMFGGVQSPTSFSINLNSLIPQNSPYYSEEEKRLASARPFIARK